MQRIDRNELANSKVAGGCKKSSCGDGCGSHHHHHSDPCDKPKDPCQPKPPCDPCEPTPQC